MELRLEAIVLPVTDVDRAKSFYERCGFGLDVDHAVSDEFRVVQFTPPGSPCSILFGVGLPASSRPVRGLHLVATDVVAAHNDLVGRGIEFGDVYHFASVGPGTTAPGPHPERLDFGTYAEFSDPDGNVWLIQEKGHGGA